MQELIKEQGLKSVQIMWENISKPDLKKNLRILRSNQLLTEQEIKKVEQRLREYIQIIEADLYPERKNNQGGSGWIWFLVIIGVIIMGLVGFLWYRKSKKQSKKRKSNV